MKRWTIRALATVAALGLLAAGCGGGGGEDDPGGDPDGGGLAGAARDPAPDVSGVALPDSSTGGEPFPTVAEDGSLLLVYFGFTSCPDVCPTTMADVRAVHEDLGEDAERVDLAMVTVDPERDTGEVLTGYVQTFVPGAHALRTDDPAMLRDAADAFGADYALQQGPSGEPEVSHTGALYVVDDAGRMVLQWSFGTTAEDMTRDLEILLDRSASAT